MPTATALKPRVSRLIVAAVALGVLTGLLVLFWQWRSPQVFGHSSTLPQDDDWPVGEPMYVGITHEPRDAHGNITIQGAEPSIVRNSAGAQVAYFVCAVDPTGGAGSIGSVDSITIGHQCSSLRSEEDRVMELNSHPRQQVVMSVTPTEPGTVEIDGTKLSYSYGWRRGAQFLDAGLVLTAVE